MTAAKTIRSLARYVHRNNGLQWTDNYFDAKGSSCIIENVSKHLSDFNSIFSLYTRCILSRGKGLAPLRLSTAVLRRHMLKHRLILILDANQIRVTRYIARIDLIGRS